MTPTPHRSSDIEIQRGFAPDPWGYANAIQQASTQHLYRSALNGMQQGKLPSSREDLDRYLDQEIGI